MVPRRMPRTELRAPIALQPLARLPKPKRVGSLASQFRGAWPQTSRTLQTVKAELDELRQRVERINADIMAAGGN